MNKPDSDLYSEYPGEDRLRKIELALTKVMVKRNGTWVTNVSPRGITELVMDVLNAKAE